MSVANDEITVRLLGPGDADTLAHVAPDLFDHPVDLARTEAFLAADSHLMVVAMAERTVVSFASGVLTLHPDKPTDLWIKELGTADSHQRQGLARQVLQALIAVGRARGAQEAWVLTDDAYPAAQRLYTTLGAERTDDVVMFSWD